MTKMKSQLKIDRKEKRNFCSNLLKKTTINFSLLKVILVPHLLCQEHENITITKLHHQKNLTLKQTNKPTHPPHIQRKHPLRTKWNRQLNVLLFPIPESGLCCGKLQLRIVEVKKRHAGEVFPLLQSGKKTSLAYLFL